MAALKAVRQMHADSSRLLLDLDRAMVGYKPVYGSVATMDLSYDIKRGAYMSEGLLRHWVRHSEPNQVIAVNLVFWDDNANVEEPLFIAAKLLYAESLSNTPDRNKAWDPWYAYLNWMPKRMVGIVTEGKPHAKRTDLLRVASVGAPLASISSENVARELLQVVVDHRFD